MTDLKDWISDLDRARVPDLWPPRRRAPERARHLPVSKLVTIAAALVIGLVPVTLIVVAMHRGTTEPQQDIRGNIRTGATPGQPLARIISMDLGPGNSAFMVRCASAATSDTCHQRTVLVSHDGGRTWEQRSTEPLSIVDTVAPGGAYGAMDCAGQRSCVQIVRTVDGGHTWKQLGRINAPGLDVARPAGSSLSVGGLVWFASEGMLFHSLDGHTWTRSPSPCPGGTELTSVSFSGSTFGYATCELAGAGHLAPKALLQTDDEGQTWHVVSRVGFGHLGLPSLPDIGTLPLSGYHTVVSFPAGFQAGFLTTQGGGLYLTTDEGRDFQPIAATDDAYFPVGVGALGPRSFVLALSSGQILATDDGGTTWTQRYPAPSLTRFSFSTPSDGVAVGSMGLGTLPSGTIGDVTQLFATHDGAASWSAVGPLPSRIPGPTWLASPAPNVIYLAWCGAKNVLYRSDDGGATWSRMSAPDATPLEGLSFLSPTEGYMSSGNRLYRTTDGARSWTSVAVSSDISITGLAPSSSPAGITIWAVPAGVQGGVGPPASQPTKAGPTQPYGSPILRSDDGGRSFTPFLSRTGLTPLALTALDGQHVWVSAWACPNALTTSPSAAAKTQSDCSDKSPVLLRTTDGGRTWQTIRLQSSPLPGDAFRFVSPETGFWLSSDGLGGMRAAGILVTHDGGVTWQPAA